MWSGSRFVLLAVTATGGLLALGAGALDLAAAGLHGAAANRPARRTVIGLFAANMVLVTAVVLLVHRLA